MSRVMIVSYAGYPYSPSSLMPDNGLASLAAVLLAAGHEVQLLDYSTVDTLERLYPRNLSDKVRPLAEKLFVEERKLSWLDKIRFLKAAGHLERHQAEETERIAEEIAAKAERFGADYLGLKLWNGDGFSGSIRIAEAARSRLPRVTILGGGPHVDYFGRHILDYTTAFDILIQGEGEHALPELIAAHESGADWRDIPGMVWRDGAGISENPAEPLGALDHLPLPVYDLERYPALKGDMKIRIGVLDESRGCPNRCAFCIHPIKSGGKWSLKSPRRVADELETLMTQLASRFFIYSGSNTSAKVALGIAQEILDRGLDVRYGCFGHINGIAKADFDLLKESGCEAIFYGLESGSERILRDSFHKPMDMEKVERVLRQTKEAGIATITSLIYPAPFEDKQSREETMSLLRRVRPDSAPVTIPGMIPGTPWERTPQDFGFVKAPRKDLWEYALTYKIKLLYPPSLWKPLPYTLDGKSSRRLMRECEEFINEIEREGIVTNLSHELVLMADALGQRNDMKSFRNRCRAMFLGGDARGVADMVGRINAAVRPVPRRTESAVAGGAR
jgi:radical SAM superfamily enzyme YgiQ (UPF0313 family)